MMLDKLTKVVDDINTTNSILDKRSRLSRYPEIKEILYYVYNPMYVYHVTSKSIHKYKQKDKSVNKNIVETLTLSTLPSNDILYTHKGK